MVTQPGICKPGHRLRQPIRHSQGVFVNPSLLGCISPQRRSIQASSDLWAVHPGELGTTDRAFSVENRLARSVAGCRHFSMT